MVLVNKNPLQYLNSLNKIPGVGSQKMKLLLDFFGEPEKIWNATLTELKASGAGEKLAEKIFECRTQINPEVEWGKIMRYNIRIITLNDIDYPKLLKEIHNPPYLLYARGELSALSSPMISVIGSRKYTSYGSQAASALAKDLTNVGLTIVSGMAIGIDTLAHHAALSAGGKTIAVLGSSIDDPHIYPRVNFNLSKEIMNNGCLLSDYPVETPALAGNFPPRNRIIAGMSFGTLVIEAGEQSGTLITARMALEYGREVFSVPGSIFSAQSVGTHELIKKGAKLVNNVKDILEELQWNNKKGVIPSEPKIPSSKEEESLLRILSHEPIHIDKMCQLSKLGAAQASPTLSIMEMKGWVKNIGGQNYILL